MKKQLKNPLWGLALFVLTMILFSTLPPLYDGQGYTTAHWITILLLVVSIPQILIGLIFWNKR